MTDKNNESALLLRMNKEEQVSVLQEIGFTSSKEHVDTVFDPDCGKGQVKQPASPSDIFCNITGRRIFVHAGETDLLQNRYLFFRTDDDHVSIP